MSRFLYMHKVVDEGIPHPITHLPGEIKNIKLEGEPSPRVLTGPKSLKLEDEPRSLQELRGPRGVSYPQIWRHRWRFMASNIV